MPLTPTTLKNANNVKLETDTGGVAWSPLQNKPPAHHNFDVQEKTSRIKDHNKWSEQ